MHLHLLHWPTSQPLLSQLLWTATCCCPVGCSPKQLSYAIPSTWMLSFPKLCLLMHYSQKANWCAIFFMESSLATWSWKWFSNAVLCTINPSGSFPLHAALHGVRVDVLFPDKGRVHCFCIFFVHAKEVVYTVVCVGSCITVGAQCYGRNEHSCDFSGSCLMHTGVVEKSRATDVSLV